MILKFAESVLSPLRDRIRQGIPDLSSANGDIFVVAGLPLAALVPRNPADAGSYLLALQGLPEELRPKRLHVLPTGDPVVPIVINADLTIEAGKTFIAGREVRLFP